jgi:hypothetical protein
MALDLIERGLVPRLMVKIDDLGKRLDEGPEPAPCFTPPFF